MRLAISLLTALLVAVALSQPSPSVDPSPSNTPNSSNYTPSPSNTSNVTVPSAAPLLFITEVMAQPRLRPLTLSYLELFNPRSQSIDISNVYIDGSLSLSAISPWLYEALSPLLGPCLLCFIFNF